MSLFIAYLLDGVALGMIYALVAVGYSLIFSILRIVNFAHGSIYAFGAMMSFMFINKLGVNPWLALLGSIILTGIMGVILNKVGIEPLRKKNCPPIATLISTIGFSYVIQNALIMIFGSGRQNFPAFFDFGMIKIGSLELPSMKVFLFIICALLLAILTILINKTHIGLAIRAVQQNNKAAMLMGINVNQVVTLAFLLAGLSASIAGTLVSGYYRVSYPMMGSVMGNKTFAAALLGGLGALYGSMVGGLIVGILESFVAGYLGATFRDAVSFIILIVILIFKPEGLFGKKGINKV